MAVLAHGTGSGTDRRLVSTLRLRFSAIVEMVSEWDKEQRQCRPLESRQAVRSLALDHLVFPQIFLPLSDFSRSVCLAIVAAILQWNG
jgi:hypothetical protein